MKDDKSNIKKQKFLLALLVGVLLMLCFLLAIPLISANPTDIFGPTPIGLGPLAQVTDSADVNHFIGDGVSTHKALNESADVIYSVGVDPFLDIKEEEGEKVNDYIGGMRFDPGLQWYIADAADVGYVYDSNTAASLSTGQFLEYWGYYAIIDAPSNIINAACGVKKGLTKLLMGTYTFATHPAQTFDAISTQLATQIVYLRYYPGKTIRGYGSAIASSYNENPAEFIGERAFDVFLIAAPFAKGFRAGQVGRGGTVAGPDIVYSRSYFSRTALSSKSAYQYQLLKKQLFIQEYGLDKASAVGMTKAIAVKMGVRELIRSVPAAKFGGNMVFLGIRDITPKATRNIFNKGINMGKINEGLAKGTMELSDDIVKAFELTKYSILKKPFVGIVETPEFAIFTLKIPKHAIESSFYMSPKWVTRVEYFEFAPRGLTGPSYFKRLFKLPGSK